MDHLLCLLVAGIYSVLVREVEHTSSIACLEADIRFLKPDFTLGGIDPIGDESDVKRLAAEIIRPRAPSNYYLALVAITGAFSPLNGKSGRDVVNVMQKLAQSQKCAILLVTHDNRILDIADRIVHMEDGHLVSDKRKC